MKKKNIFGWKYFESSDNWASPEWFCRNALVALNFLFTIIAWPFQSWPRVQSLMPSPSLTISVSTMVQTLINIYGTEEQKKKFLPPLCQGEEIASFALSESSAGSDAASLKTSAKKVPGGWTLNGNKLWISSAGLAKTYRVMARTGEAGPKGISAFLVRDGAPGFSYGKNEKKMGVRVSPTRELVFHNCFVPDDQLQDRGFHGVSGSCQKSTDRAA
ncbi:MAG: Acyl-CoA dehydrogenase [Parcubacteria group bacterium GW2011_GWA1_33_6]|nr:MAG: Acyl-CoA dehydrogenase [Parcubacteria group bacterium GW2011_GWA1_33_6]